MRLMEELQCSIEVWVREEVRTEFLKELQKAIMQKHTHDMEDLKSMIEEQLRELAASHLAAGGASAWNFDACSQLILSSFSCKIRGLFVTRAPDTRLKVTGTRHWNLFH